MLSAASLDRIEAAIADAEKATSCEFAVVLAPASSRYGGRAMAAGVAAAIIVFVALYWINDLWLNAMPDPLLLMLEAVAAGGLTATAFARVSWLRRLVIPAWRMNAAVDDAAHAAFSEENVSLTKDRNACLLYVSLLEGQVRLMPDIGMQTKVHDAALGEIQAMLANADTGDAVALICDAIAKLGNACKDCFPYHTADQNELPDRPQTRMP